MDELFSSFNTYTNNNIAMCYNLQEIYKLTEEEQSWLSTAKTITKSPKDDKYS